MAKDYGFVGINNDEIDERVDDLLDFVDSFKGSAGGSFGEDIETCIDFPYETLALEKFSELEKAFRKKYPTFDGHLYLHDLNHFTAEESKILDSIDSLMILKMNLTMRMKVKVGKTRSKKWVDSDMLIL